MATPRLRHRRRQRPRRALTAALIALIGTLMLGFTGCSDDPPPGEAAPVLAANLDDVDAAIEDGKWAQARTAVEGLVAETAQAQVAGDISDDQADRIFEAARDVLEQLPDPEPEDSEGQGTKDESSEGEDSEGEGGGNGDSSENGPDDEHGN